MKLTPRHLTPRTSLSPRYGRGSSLTPRKLPPGISPRKPSPSSGRLSTSGVKGSLTSLTSSSSSSIHHHRNHVRSSSSTSSHSRMNGSKSRPGSKLSHSGSVESITSNDDNSKTVVAGELLTTQSNEQEEVVDTTGEPVVLSSTAPVPGESNGNSNGSPLVVPNVSVTASSPNTLLRSNDDTGSLTGVVDGDIGDVQGNGVQDDPDGLLAGQSWLVSLLKNTSCYELAPQSSKIVVLDVELPINRAFYALLSHDLRSAPLWDSRAKEFVGMLTITDFINILLRSHESEEVQLPVLEEYMLREWRELAVDARPQAMVSVDPTESVWTVLGLLNQYGIHRVPVVDKSPGALHAVLSILSHARILRFVVDNMDEVPEFLFRSVEDLGIGTFTSVIKMLPDTPLINVLKVIRERNISAVPIVDENGILQNVYSKNDVAILARKRLYSDLNISVTTALNHRTEPRPIRTCTRSDRLLDIIDKLSTFRIHRLMCIDSEGHVEGVVSLNDILRFFRSGFPGLGS